MITVLDLSKRGESNLLDSLFSLVSFSLVCVFMSSEIGFMLTEIGFMSATIGFSGFLFILRW